MDEYPRYYFVEYVKTVNGRVKGIEKNFYDIDEAEKFGEDFEDFEIGDRKYGRGVSPRVLEKRI